MAMVHTSQHAASSASLSSSFLCSSQLL